MAITQAICDSFKTQLLQGKHNFTVLTGTNTVSSVAAATGTAGPNGTATTTYTGTFTNGATDAYVGLTLTWTGFTATNNNGTYMCVASSTTTVTLANPNGTSSVAGAPLLWLSGQNIYGISLYPSTSTLDKTTQKFGDPTGEVGSSGTYVTGGIGPGGTLLGNAMALVSTTPVLSTDTACCLFSTIAWTTATITARGALIYNASLGTDKAHMPAVMVLNFTTDQTSTNGTFTITFPAQTAGNAIIQLV